jgi:antitoxin component of MazEF toxin-antitoxin module
MGELTSLNKATTKNESLRTTVPRSIIKHFGLTDEDKLEWNLKVENGEIIIHVKPIKSVATVTGVL